MNYILAILIIIILNAAYVFVERNDTKVAESENKRLYVDIRSVGVWHRWEVDNVNVKLVRSDE